MSKYMNGLQCVALEKCVGKTITGFVAGRWGSKWLVIFSDGAIAIIGTSGDDDPVDRAYSRSDYDDEELLKVGLLTPATLASEQAQKAAQALREAEHAKIRERQLFEKLKKQFEPDAPVAKSELASPAPLPDFGCSVVDVF